VLGVSGFGPAVPVFDELVLTSFLFIQALTERHNPLFSIVIPVGPLKCFREYSTNFYRINSRFVSGYPSDSQIQSVARPEEGAELSMRFIGHLFRWVVPARQHSSADVDGALEPGFDRSVTAIDVAVLSP
jgi:hypothetical protein